MLPMNHARLTGLVAAVLLALVATAAEKPATTQSSDAKWQSLFNGKDLGKWKSTEFGGEGEVRVENGKLILGSGEVLTGVTWTGGNLPHMNYEVELDAMRVNGDDFFCGLTFPVNDSHASLIVGGWGGPVCGISSLDGNDAANNDTTTVHQFKRGEWYHIRVRVLPNRLQAWLEDE